MKLIGIILTYNCEKLVQKAIDKIPKNILHDVICADDASSDNTKSILEKIIYLFYSRTHRLWRQPFFGLKKLLKKGATHVIEIHGDGQYDLNRIIDVEKMLNDDKNIDLILGNRFYEYKKPLENKMGLIKFFGNIGVTFIASIGLGIRSRDLFPGFRVYSKNFYNSLNFEKLSKFYWFSFEIIALSVFNKLKIRDIPADCDYKTEHTSMSMWKGFPFIFHTIKTVIQFRLQK